MTTMLKKYQVAAPRYTSYPTVPYWDTTAFREDQWQEGLAPSFAALNNEDGISLYIHLPFCERLCTYCGCNKYITVNHDHEIPYINTVLQEWELYLQHFPEKPRIREVHLGGGTPTFFSPANLTRLLNAIFETADVLPGAEHSFEGHPNNTTPEHMQALYDLGFRRMSLGIQDLDLNVQTIINRIQPFENVRNCVEAARRIGYTSINFDLIYGLPLQTPKSIRETFTQCMFLLPERISFYSYAHVPWIKGNGQRLFSEKDLPSGDQKRALYELGKSILENYFYVEIGMDHFALPDDKLFEAAADGSLHRNFMGYTDHRTSLLIGLGVSAISDTGNAYTQNEKSLAAYQEKVRQGKLPVFRGHMLTKEDLRLRNHILHLMCRFETHWDRQDANCDAISESLQRLQEPERDGLVEVRPDGVIVTEKGKPYIRNICMAFDARLWRNVPQTQLFSNAV
ncbi:oxygen-independent coproporphyrinogen III oxidase [Chitinophaga caseinilytica]|uniref:Coproporphyrinogen-III oxidase n=1 Tax=Chitinophaga caseinilytica TaxID=2267521 RepID=A0ABZ2ZA86_9BACT